MREAIMNNTVYVPLCVRAMRDTSYPLAGNMQSINRLSSPSFMQGSRKGSMDLSTVIIILIILVVVLGIYLSAGDAIREALSKLVG